jgi:sodium/hydrogen exchanger 8
MIILFAQSSYLFAEILNLSGVMSLFMTGIVMHHYSKPPNTSPKFFSQFFLAFYSTSKETRTSTSELFKTWAFLAETFLFVYLGINALAFTSNLKWDPKLIFVSLVSNHFLNYIFLNSFKFYRFLIFFRSNSKNFT